jgi:hypothetical protein
MRRERRIAFFCLQAVAAVFLAPPIAKGEPLPGKGSVERPLSLTSYGTQQPASSSEKTIVTTKESSTTGSWEIDGPVFLRSADPEPPGEVVIKNIFGWETTRGGGSDDFEYEFEIEWGVVENHELIFALPWELGDGRIDDNGDAEIGWHWRLWEEHDGWPAFAMRNIVMVPTGVDSAYVDYIWRGLMTWTITPGATRFHVNPLLKVANRDYDNEDVRPFQYAMAVGIDHWLISDELLLITDYIYSHGETRGTRDNHTGELGLDWHFTERQTLGVAAEVGLDGDSNGPTFGVNISYMFDVGGK